MKLAIYVFSGTGNTIAVAELYKKYLNAEVTIYRISENSGTPPPPDEFELIGIGYPIHAFCAPEPILEFVKNLPIVQNKRAFIFKTSGEGLHLNDCSSQKVIKILSRKGYDVVLERHIVMPYNMIFRHSDAMAKHMWIYAKALVKANCCEIEKGVRENVKKFRISRIWTAPVGFIERHFAHLHGTAFKIDSEKCLKCGECIKNCPENNITLQNNKYKFGHKCVLCMGCSFNCPVDAIKIGIFKYWKVNGSYRLEVLEKDESLPFPFIPEQAKGIYRLYKKYYREADLRLKEAGLNINDFIFKG